MTLKEIRIKSGVTVKQILNAYPDKRMDKSLYSKIENGIVPCPLKLSETVLNMCGRGFVDESTKSAKTPVATAQIAILNAISNGKRTRRELCTITGLDDRAVRNAICELQRMGHIIINNQDGEGYYTTSNLNEIARHYMQERKRAISRLSALKHERKLLKKAGIL